MRWGGDYYDVINIEGKEWVAIGDVSGHGVSAGLIMMMVQTSIRIALDQNPDLEPSDLLTLVNRTVSKNIRQFGEDKYMTITVLAFHENGKFYFSGLHQDIMIWRKDISAVELVETQGIWIGVVDEIDGMLENKFFSIHPGDTY